MNGYKSREEAITAWNARPVEDALRAERDAALAEAARHKALWDSVPWPVLGYVISVARAWSEDRQITAEAVDWFNANAPRTEDQP
jgi:hypothetical protein